MTNKQKQDFKNFLNKNVKNEYYNFEAYIFDLEKQVGETGSSYYELSKNESKSGKPEIFYLEEDQASSDFKNGGVKKMIKVNNKIVKGLNIAYDTCHKIYICEDETDVENAKKWGYDLYPINKLQELYNSSCELKFISNWKLTEYYVKQFENAIFEEV